MTSLQMTSRMIKSYFGWGVISMQQHWTKICYVTTISTIGVYTGRKTTALTRILKFMCKIGRKRSLVWPQIRDLSSLYKRILWSTVSNAFVRSTNYVASRLISHVDGSLFETHLPITIYVYICIKQYEWVDVNGSTASLSIIFSQPEGSGSPVWWKNLDVSDYLDHNWRHNGTHIVYVCAVNSHVIW